MLEGKQENFTVEQTNKKLFKKTAKMISREEHLLSTYIPQLLSMRQP